MYRILWNHEKNVYVLYRDNIECGTVTSEVVSKELAILFDEHESPNVFLERFAELEETIANLESDLEEKQEEKEEQYEELNEEILRLEGEVDDGLDTIGDLEGKIAELESDLEEKQEEIKELGETIDKLKEEIEDFKDYIKTLEP